VIIVPKRRADNDARDEDDLFISFDEELAEMRERMDRIFDSFMRNELGPERAPLVYGFSVQTSSDGEPVVREVSNTPAPAQLTSGGPDDREPLIDVMESDDTVRVIVELPGVRKDDIKIDAHERLLDIEVDNEAKQFRHQVDLPCDIQPDSVKASCKNGVLVISMRRAVKRKKKGRTVKVD
jgi:HSP20 family protein